ncbi:MAG TPA: NAD(P)H-hydrate dehydratase [Gemmataceae bacterium]|nr:NAD(P)H-hydrate dehydratase [Gemmataceae bacterium]
MNKPPANLQIVTEVPKLPQRAADSNKGTYGRVLVVAGSRGMSGAAVLCGSAALRGGAGLVRVAVPREILPIVAAGNPCYMTAALPQDTDGRLDRSAENDILTLAGGNNVVAIGPGLGHGSSMTVLLTALLNRFQAPLVLDADGLNAFVQNTPSLKRSFPLILTPHPGEFSRLLNLDTATVQAHRRELATAFAAENGLVLLLKGHHTVVTDGQRIFENTTGNPGMATAGSGDVLTGLIAALLAQGLEPFAAAQLGAYVHGLAGDLAKTEAGEVGMIATDLLTHLPKALRQVQS